MVRGGVEEEKLCCGEIGLIPGGFDRMDSPSPGLASGGDFGEAVADVANEGILFAEIAEAEAEMMGKGWGENFHIDGVGFGNRSHAGKGFASPERARGDHTEDDVGISAAGDFFPEFEEVGVRRLGEEMGAVGLVDAAKMKAEDVGVFGLEEGELALVEIGDEREVIVFGEVNIIEVAVLEPSGGGSKNSCVTLALALMIAGAESGIIDEDFLGEVERMEIGRGAAVSDEDLGERDRFFPVAEHRLHGLRALVSEEEIEGGAHEESPGEEVT